MEKLNFIYDKSLGIAKYQQLADALMHYIRHNSIPAGTPMPSDQKLSRQFKISTSTVNKSYNELVKYGLLERIVGAGTFVAGGNAALKQKESVVLGLFSHETLRLDKCYVSEMLEILNRKMKERNWILKIIVRSPEYFYDVYKKENMQGMIFFTPLREFTPIIQDLLRKNIPLCSVGSIIPGNENISFDTNHVLVSKNAIKYLHRLGHRKIGIITPLSNDEEPVSSQKRDLGLMYGMYECGLPLNPDWMITLKEDSLTELQDKLAGLRRRNDLPTAFLIAQHRNILGVYQILRRMGLQIPEDVSLIGFDDPDYAAYLSPPLTVYKQNLDLIISSALANLEAQLSGGVYHGLHCDALLIERNSCRKN